MARPYASIAPRDSAGLQPSDLWRRRITCGLFVNREMSLHLAESSRVTVASSRIDITVSILEGIVRWSDNPPVRVMPRWICNAAATIPLRPCRWGCIRVRKWTRPYTCVDWIHFERAAYSGLRGIGIMHRRLLDGEKRNNYLSPARVRGNRCAVLAGLSPEIFQRRLQNVDSNMRRTQLKGGAP